MSRIDGERLYTIRPATDPSDLIAVTPHGEILVEQICAECFRRGAIWHAHPESEDHKGSPNFKPWKPTRAYYLAKAQACVE